MPYKRRNGFVGISGCLAGAILLAARVEGSREAGRCISVLRGFAFRPESLMETWTVYDDVTRISREFLASMII